MKINQRELLGRRLKELRKRKGLSQEELSEMADTSPNYLSRMERGTENPTLDMLIKISEALSVEMWELFDFQHQANSRQLKEILRKFTGEIDNEEKLRTAVRMIRILTR